MQFRPHLRETRERDSSDDGLCVVLHRPPAQEVLVAACCGHVNIIRKYIDAVCDEPRDPDSIRALACAGLNPPPRRANVV